MLWLILRALLPSAGDRVTILITDDTTRAELEEAMANIVGTLHRMPAHWVDRRAALHAKLDALLEDWQQAKA